ncbi:MAG: shikimate dehydrogenase [Puniceicoccales bacterium]|jgi:shikimate dehydrogenase|nr:shikimate dehydrogenase [Puniceicoccales bacterium]
MSTTSFPGFDCEHVFTLADLEHWQRREPSLAVIGQPIGHSRSPRMQNAALAALAGEAPELARWRYYKFEIAPQALPQALQLFHGHNFIGLNLTLPHKVLACAHVTHLAAAAAAAGAVNTLVRNPDGYTGHNTDGPGFARALLENPGAPLRDATIALLGAGGAARAIAATALSEGCSALWIGNRDSTRLETLLSALRKSFPEAAGRIRGFLLSAGIIPLPEIPTGAIVVNATSLGLKPDDPSPVPASFWRPEMCAYDIVYGSSETAFLRDARVAGAPGADGRSMLCWQGALAFELWTGRKAPVELMRQMLEG